MRYDLNRDRLEGTGLFLERAGEQWKIFDNQGAVHQLGIGEKQLRLTVNRLVNEACSCWEGRAAYLKTRLERRVS